MSYYYHRCPLCGAYLDPGEKCACIEKAADSAANTDNGKTENETTPVSASDYNKNMGENKMNNSFNYDELDISQFRSLDFYETARILSKYIRELPLSVEQNNKLIELAVNHMEAAERGAFLGGSKVMAKFMSEGGKNNETRIHSLNQ